MKTPKKELPQKERNPESFPKVTTIPDGWDLSEHFMKGRTKPQENPTEVKKRIEDDPKSAKDTD